MPGQWGAPFWYGIWSRESNGAAYGVRLYHLCKVPTSVSKMHEHGVCWFSSLPRQLFEIGGVSIAKELAVALTKEFGMAIDGVLGGGL